MTISIKADASGTFGTIQVGGVDAVIVSNDGINAGSYKAGSIVSADIADGVIQEIGNGQTYQNMTASRVSGTTYYNTTGKPIFLSYWWEGATGIAMHCHLFVDTLEVGALYIPATPSYASKGQLTAIVPPLSSFYYTESAAVGRLLWELR